MKKIIRTLTIAVIALVAVFACTFALACNGGNGGDKKSDYNFTIVYEDGTAVNGQKDSTTGGKVWLQVCTDRCIDLNFKIERYADENGKISISQKDLNTWFDSTTDVTEFKFHVRNVKDCKDDVEISVNGKGDYKVTVTK
ncbi:MAG: hypothetical protein K2O62_01310 [Clostridia bacterium]|nr:hypothetical protein [Clostridia bacterium]